MTKTTTKRKNETADSLFGPAPTEKIAKPEPAKKNQPQMQWCRGRCVEP